MGAFIYQVFPYGCFYLSGVFFVVHLFIGCLVYQNLDSVPVSFPCFASCVYSVFVSAYELMFLEFPII